MSETTMDTRPTSTIYRTLVTMTGMLVLGALMGFAISNGQGFQVDLDSKGKVVLHFEGRKASLAELLDKALIEAGSGEEKRYAEIVLESLGYYHISNRRLVDALRDLRNGKETHDFTSALRELLYDLKGPFSRPYTFSGARDDRLLQAFEDLDPEGKNPEAVSPLLSSIWSMSLTHEGVLRPRLVNAVVEAAADVQRDRASTCIGSILGGKEVLINGGGRLKKALVDADWGCSPRSPQELLAGEPERLRLAPDDFAMLGGSISADGSTSELQVTLLVSPMHFRSWEISLPQHASILPRQ